MTFRCAICSVNWDPAMAKDGRCPECGHRTTRDHVKPPSPDAQERYAVAMERRAEEEAAAQRLRDFEEYCAARDQEALAVTEREIAALPEIEPQRPMA